MKLNNLIKVNFEIPSVVFYLGLLYYLAFPYFIFFWGWLKPLYSLSCISLLTIQLFLATKLILQNKKSFNPLIAPRWQWFLCLLILLCWTIYSGSGNFGYQNYDYMKHNGIYHDLVAEKWPASIHWMSEKYYLVYYFAHYIFPALIGKIAGFQGLEWTALLQTYLGLVLIFFSISSFISTSNILVILLSFIFWGGLDLIGSCIFKNTFSGWSEYPEWWAGLSTFQYTGFSDLLFWVPQHAIGGWGITLLCLIAIQSRQWIIIPSFVSLGLLWSPLACLGLLPFIFVGIINLIKEKNLKALFASYSMYFSCLMLLVFSLLYSSQFYAQPLKWQYLRLGASSFISKYFIFCLLEFGLIMIPIFVYYKSWSQELRQLLIPALIALLIFPHIYFGHYSDVAMRSSIPMLLLCFIFFWKTFYEFLNHKVWRLILCTYIVIGAYSAFSDIHRAQRLKPQKLDYRPIMLYDPNGLSQQYLGKQDAYFFKHLSKY